MVDGRLRRAIPLTAVLLVVAAALVLIATDHWRRGATTLGVAALLAALLRTVLSERAAGPLAVRRKRFDVPFLLMLAVLLGILVSRP